MSKYQKKTKEEISEVRRKAVLKRWEGKSKEEIAETIKALNETRREKRAAMRKIQEGFANG